MQFHSLAADRRRFIRSTAALGLLQGFRAFAPAWAAGVPGPDGELGAASGRPVELGVRLRYEIRREPAPYIGVNWTRKVGETANITRTGGEDTRSVSVVVGIRAWY